MGGLIKDTHVCTQTNTRIHTHSLTRSLTHRQQQNIYWKIFAQNFWVSCNADTRKLSETLWATSICLCLCVHWRYRHRCHCAATGAAAAAAAIVVFAAWTFVYTFFDWSDQNLLMAAWMHQYLWFLLQLFLCLNQKLFLLRSVLFSTDIKMEESESESKWEREFEWCWLRIKQTFTKCLSVFGKCFVDTINDASECNTILVWNVCQQRDVISTRSKVVSVCSQMFEWVSA